MDWCPFRVQIHGLPLGVMNEKIGVLFGDALRDVEEVETDDAQIAWEKHLIVRVSINVMKPLKRGKMILVERNGKVLAMFRYERLPDFCYVCGRLDH